MNRIFSLKPSLGSVFTFCRKLRSVKNILKRRSVSFKDPPMPEPPLILIALIPADYKKHQHTNEKDADSRIHNIAPAAARSFDFVK